MHLNPIHPNILHDMQAAANGRDLRSRRQVATGMFALTAKRHLIPRKSYPYASERQAQRQQSRVPNVYTEIVDMYKSHPEYPELGIFAGYGKQADGDYGTKCLTARIAAEIQAETEG